MTMADTPQCEAPASDPRRLVASPLLRLEGDGGDPSAPVFFEVLAQHLNGGGTLHGGVLACAFDSALGERVHAAAVRAGRGPRRVVTTQLDVHYCEAAGAGDRVAIAVSVIRLGGRLAVAEALATADGRVIGKAVGSFYLRR